MDEQAVQRDVLIAFEYSYQHDDWVYPLADALAALQAYIETNSLDALAGSPYGLEDLFCRFIHNAYHIGQITKMRELRTAQDAPG